MKHLKSIIGIIAGAVAGFSYWLAVTQEPVP